ncbi:isocitrate lyase/phosphoenolpyruvate mutase family protein [Isoptericola sp. NEAU-Y5]|uniref:Isocitrate lyase/phosphoenolpyruvate mutase family protein n=1 Tax=Isoptericola luteus TaxID=2879484 RepID=A0ABS7ZGP0_9MICO|nr:isocitrate lyase/phosphoenolpyruvate mutase family protein [Isoptericola sp. NEAU-Y5]MCA5894198.1 isocitrate lyase/phosphoenolpyruvate mutase family protein [Isoptericola sp. NEAU-Y5]
MALTDRAAFLALHRPGDPLLLPNAWDAGSARILAALGFAALATTSSGFAATLGRADGAVTRDEALAHAAVLAAAVDVPVSADLENGFGDSPDDVARTVADARGTGVAGCSIEDHTGRDDDPIYDRTLAVERIAAAAEASGDVVLTARAENHLHGRDDLADTIARLQAYQEAGADVLYAPGLRDAGQVATLCREVDRPVNVLLVPGGPDPAALAEAGVARISVGGAFAWNALSGLIDAARELQAGSTAFLDRTAPARELMPRAFQR